MRLRPISIDVLRVKSRQNMPPVRQQPKNLPVFYGNRMLNTKRQEPTPGFIPETYESTHHPRNLFFKISLFLTLFQYKDF